MARITVEDCLENVDNRFQLVLVATKRARQITNGADPLVPEDNDKPTVIALREIAEGLVGPAILDEEDIPPELSPFDPRAGVGEGEVAGDGFGIGAGFGGPASDAGNPFAPAGAEGTAYESDADADAALIAALQRELAAAADAEQRAIAADASAGSNVTPADPFKTTPDNAPDLPPLAPTPPAAEEMSDSELLGATAASSTIPPEDENKLWGLPAAGAAAISSTDDAGTSADTPDVTPQSFTGSSAFTEAPTPSVGASDNSFGGASSGSDSADTTSSGWGGSGLAASTTDTPALFGASTETPADPTPADSTPSESGFGPGGSFGSSTSAFTSSTTADSTPSVSSSDDALTPEAVFGESTTTASEQSEEEETTEFNLFADAGSDSSDSTSEDSDGDSAASEDSDKLDT